MSLAAISLCYVQLIGFTHGVSVLMGAPFFTDVLRTLLFSSYLVLIGFTPIIISLKGNFKDVYRFIFENDTYLTMANSRNYYLMRNLVWGTIIGAWLGAIPIPLDWDRWWQRWPITCLVSSTLGAGLSVIVSYLWLWIRRKQKYNEDID